MGTGLDADDIIQAGSATTDKLTATANGLTATTGKLSISGVDEILLTTVTAASTIDASGITGASIIRFNGAATANSSNTVDTTLTNLAAGTKVGFGGNDNATGWESKLTVSLADSSGSSDSLTLELGDVNEDDDIGGSIAGTGIETLIINDPIPQRTLSLMSMVCRLNFKVTGGKAGEALDIAASSTLNASTWLLTSYLMESFPRASTNTSTTFTTKTVAGTLTGGALLTPSPLVRQLPLVS